MRSAFLFLMAAVSCLSAEPNWPAVEAHAVELLQKYVRIRSINPPADTRETAALLAEELKAAGLEAKLYMSAPDGRTNLIVRLAGKDRERKPGNETWKPGSLKTSGVPT